jgi:hypothetical protein
LGYTGRDIQDIPIIYRLKYFIYYEFTVLFDAVSGHFKKWNIYSGACMKNKSKLCI